MRRVYQRQMRPTRRGMLPTQHHPWEDIRLKDLRAGFPVAPLVKGGPFGSLTATLRQMPPGEVLHTLRCRYRVIER